MEQADFGALVDKYEKLVYTICYQFTQNHHTAQDLAQETYLSVYTHLDSCPADNPKAWVARIATNKAKDHLKSAYHRRVQSVADDAMPSEGTLYITAPQPQEVVQSSSTCAEITEKIDALREPYNTVAVLYFLQSYSVGEIAQRLGRPRKTVQTQLFRARGQLKTQLAPALG